MVTTVIIIIALLSLSLDWGFPALPDSFDHYIYEHITITIIEHFYIIIIIFMSPSLYHYFSLSRWHWLWDTTTIMTIIKRVRVIIMMIIFDYKDAIIIIRASIIDFLFFLSSFHIFDSARRATRWLISLIIYRYRRYEYICHYITTLNIIFKHLIISSTSSWLFIILMIEYALPLILMTYYMIYIIDGDIIS